MAILKANAYGHGAVPAGQAVLRAGATWCGVARIEEALELRRGGITCPILLLGYIPSARYKEAIINQISITVWNSRQVQQVSEAAQHIGNTAHVHLKVDTGMSRLGAEPAEALELASELARSKGVFFEGLFTHFARADEQDVGANALQENQFTGILEKLEHLAILPPYIHAANSAASLSMPKAVFNLVRPGISIYGLHPSQHCPLPGDFRPALQWKSVLSQVKLLPPGRGVSYGHIYTTQGYERIGTVPVGYGDGYRRTKGNMVLVNGQRVPVVGRVCMDQIMVQLDQAPQAREGDEVVLIGRQGQEVITAEEVAGCWGTINYEVTCGIGPRVKRIYFP